MRVIHSERLLEFARKYGDARKSLLAWLATSEAAHWKSLREVRVTYPHADGVKVDSGRIITIFNIRGGHYRLATAIDYPMELVNVLKVMTHAEYDRDSWKKTL